MRIQISDINIETTDETGFRNYCRFCWPSVEIPEGWEQVESVYEWLPTCAACGDTLTTDDDTPLPKPMRSCEACAHGCTRDVGWSNWTVEGTMFHCTCDRNPLIHDGVSWESYEDHHNRPYNYASVCHFFFSGPRRHYDVEDDFPFGNQR